MDVPERANHAAHDGIDVAVVAVHVHGALQAELRGRQEDQGGEAERDRGQEVDQAEIGRDGKDHISRVRGGDAVPPLYIPLVLQEAAVHCRLGGKFYHPQGIRFILRTIVFVTCGLFLSIRGYTRYVSMWR